MKASTISTLKKELSTLPAVDVINVCMKLAKYKKENKELLSYLLFDSNDEKEFIRSVKQEIETQFAQLKFLQIYYQNQCCPVKL
jgi:hypothetical protein